MGKISNKLRSVQDGGLMFMCPGCGEMHKVMVGEGSGPRWGYNGNPEAPTFTPSILVTWNEPSEVPEEFDDESKDVPKVCHSFVTDGRIQFLSDCTHALAGQTVAIPDLEGCPMPQTYIAKDGDMVDEICWRYYPPERFPLSVETVLDANRGLAAMGLKLKAGTAVLLPDLKQPDATPVIRLWS